ncbi:hypothetical protein AGLY_015013 [Aphis glycines]|uniref:Uncharacterized protein n=1 Tax=Aphis glycines TaxID=307491 RepID=A0A6G0T2V0_APHGL|nr:hypothetical protein AGLY_015013 [Aphis glycines]
MSSSSSPEPSPDDAIGPAPLSSPPWNTSSMSHSTSSPWYAFFSRLVRALSANTCSLSRLLGRVTSTGTSGFLFWFLMPSFITSLASIPATGVLNGLDHSHLIVAHFVRQSLPKVFCGRHVGADVFKQPVECERRTSLVFFFVFETVILVILFPVLVSSTVGTVLRTIVVLVLPLLLLLLLILPYVAFCLDDYFIFTSDLRRHRRFHVVIFVVFVILVVFVVHIVFAVSVGFTRVLVFSVVHHSSLLVIVVVVDVRHVAATAPTRWTQRRFTAVGEHLLNTNTSLIQFPHNIQFRWILFSRHKQFSWKFIMPSDIFTLIGMTTSSMLNGPNRRFFTFSMISANEKPLYCTLMFMCIQIEKKNNYPMTYPKTRSSLDRVASGPGRTFWKRQMTFLAALKLKKNTYRSDKPYKITHLASNANWLFITYGEEVFQHLNDVRVARVVILFQVPKQILEKVRILFVHHSVSLFEHVVKTHSGLVQHVPELFLCTCRLGFLTKSAVYRRTYFCPHLPIAVRSFRDNTFLAIFHKLAKMRLYIRQHKLQFV